MPHDDFQREPILGLPENLPENESILWQGRPSAWALTKDALNFWWIMGYFALLAVWRFISAIDLMPLGRAFAVSLPFLVLAAIVGILLFIVAYVQARTTVYTITTKRVAMRIGAALTVTLNIPFTQIANASLGLSKSGHGTIALETLGESRFSYLVAWPHVRPWYMSKTQPSLRAIPNAQEVAKILSQAAVTQIRAHGAKAQSSLESQRPFPLDGEQFEERSGRNGEVTWNT